jgi:Fe-S cluster assembly protein SufD
VFKSISVTNGAATSREDYLIRLQGEAAEAYLYGVWTLDGNRQHHVNICLDHQEAACTSLQKFKGILSDTSRSSFEGKIYVHPQAQKTQAYQMNNNLVLGERAAAYSKPNLEIFADDVKASHGATIGQIDPEHLFYLQARGISAHMAQMLLVQGFKNEIIDLIPHFHLREEAMQT